MRPPEAPGRPPKSPREAPEGPKILKKTYVSAFRARPGGGTREVPEGVLGGPGAVRDPAECAERLTKTPPALKAAKGWWGRAKR